MSPHMPAPDDVRPVRVWVSRRTAGAHRQRMARRALTFVMLAVASCAYVICGAAVLADAR